MPKELEFPLTTTHDGKTYEGKRVVAATGGKATQYIISHQFGQSIPDPMTYTYPEETPKMEAGATILFAELLRKVGRL